MNSPCSMAPIGVNVGVIEQGHIIMGIENQIQEALAAQSQAWDSFKTSNTQRLKTIEAELTEVLRKSNRIPAFSGGAESEQKAQFLTYMRSGREAKAMRSGDDPNGGWLVPEEIDTTLTKILREMSPMRQLARVIPITSGNFSMLHSLGGTGYSWVGETSSRPKTATPTFQKITPPLGEIYANLPISQNLLDDNGFDLENWLMDEMSEAFNAGEGDAFVNGDGVAKPRGFLTYDKIAEPDGTRSALRVEYISSGKAAAFMSSAPADKLVKLVYAMKPRYRAGAVWQMNANTLATVRTLKDASGQNMILEPSLAEATPAKLLGYPIFENENMPDISANSFSIAFGNFRFGYTIIDRSTSVLRDPYSDKPNVQFYACRRVGGAIRDTRAIKVMKFAVS